jgi:hypothetical protein
MTLHPGIRLTVAIVSISFAVIAVPTSAAMPDQVQLAIDKAQKFLLDHRNKTGTWEEVDTPEIGTDEGLRLDVKGRQWGGLTAISTYALLASGKDWRDKDLAPAIDFLLKANIEGTYSLGMSSQLALFLPPAKTRQLVKFNTGKLGNGLFLPPGGVPAIKWPENVGFYSYWTGSPAGSDQLTFNPNTRNFGSPQERDWYDRSASQYGVLGMWALEQAGGDIPKSYWAIVDTAWKRAQNNDGGWNYRQGDERTASMTAAGIATLFITQDYTLQRNWGDCRGGVKNEYIEHGLEWIDRHIDEAVNGTFYTLYGIERIGAASGRRYFGGKDWFDLGAQYLLSKQHEDGSWSGDRGEIPDTCFALLFLARGRAPLLMNKLQYESQEGRNAVPDVWDERPRDVANLAAWVGKQQESFFNWQVVNFDVPAEQLHDAPILYIAGSRMISMKEEEMKVLRAFIVGGGMIVGNADCNSPAFAAGFMKLGKGLFPKYEFKPTPANDLIWREQFTQFRTKPRVMELSNGVRKLMVLLPDDPARAWQMRNEKSGETSYELGANIFLYATDKQGGSARGAGYFASASATTQSSTQPATRPTRKIQVARLMLGPNPDPEPGGWTRLAKILWRTSKIDLTTKNVTTSNLSGFKIAHLTGTGSFSLDPKSRDALKSFVTSGGTLVIDAAGGDSAFADSMQTELEAMFGAGKLDLLPPDHPLYTKSDLKLEEPYYRRYALDHVADRKHPQLRAISLNNRLAVFFSREDLSAGLVGEEVDGIYGYTPQCATNLMAAILAYVK